MLCIPMRRTFFSKNTVKALVFSLDRVFFTKPFFSHSWQPLDKGEERGEGKGKGKGEEIRFIVG